MISALILAAGQSRRMGRPKLPLPWGANTMLGQVIEVFRVSLVEDILVVTGGDREDVEKIAEAWRARTVLNPYYASEEMLSSLQVGLGAMPAKTEAVLVALGDQPQMQHQTVLDIVHLYAESHAPLIVPSYQMHRGHPWLVARPLWGDILAMHSPETPRDFINKHAKDITYLNVGTPTV
ncbi:MAG: nucleotidyltransferase family protein, partial [Anaerolineae bacterium]